VYLGFPERFFIFNGPFRCGIIISMKFFLVALNAKFIQTNLAVRLLKAYAYERCPAVNEGIASIEIGEWNINQALSSVVRGCVAAGPDVIVFSSYIWNIELVLKVASDIKKVLPHVLIGFGGPEVSWRAETFLGECMEADFVIVGEGERTFSDVIDRLSREPATSRKVCLSSIPGLYVALDPSEGIEARIAFGGQRESIENLDDIPFPYAREKDLGYFENRIAYYESSRGCPFACAYCLSSIDRSVRYYPLERVLREIEWFIDAGFPLVKFVDRTFNLDPSRYIPIWELIRDRYTGKTLFHFEIAAECLTHEALATLETMPEGAVQFEIGIQSVNPETLRAVCRAANPEILAERIQMIPSRVHTHLDLIAGLPYENLGSFAESFNFAFSLKPGMLQLGFLKVLFGSPMERIADVMPGFFRSSFPPYEVLSTPWLSYADIQIIKDVEQVTETWFNSGLMRNTLLWLTEEKKGESGFALFQELADWIRGFYPDGDLFLPRKPVDSLACMARFLFDRRELPLEWLRYDFLLQGKPGAYPPWFERRATKDDYERALLSRGLIGLNGESRRIAYAQTEFETFRLTPEGCETPILFQYDIGSLGKKRARTLRV
jgi:radical SAM superfamily enzyme YgiQ (UPF0313 family)